MERKTSRRIETYIHDLAVDPETANDLRQEAEIAIWQALTKRAKSPNCPTYLLKTGKGTIRNWFRARSRLVRIPGYLHDRGEADAHQKTIVPLELFEESIGDSGFEEELLDRIEMEEFIAKIHQLFPILSPAERNTMRDLLAGKSITEIAKGHRVSRAVIYLQQARATSKIRKALSGQRIPKRTHAPSLEETRIAVIKIAENEGHSRQNDNGCVIVRCLRTKLEREILWSNADKLLVKLDDAFPGAVKDLFGTSRAKRWQVNLELLTHSINLTASCGAC